MKLRKIFALAGALTLSLALAGCNGAQAELFPEEELRESPLPELSEPSEQPEPLQPSELPEPPKEESPITPEQKTATARYIRVLANGLNVRTGAGTDFSALGTAERGTLLKYADRQGNWYKTEYRGRTAYVSADMRYAEEAELPAGEETYEKIIEVGLSLLGTPYVYGAVRLHDGRGHMNGNFSSAEFDCSSLMQYMFFKGGNILLDVTTRTQIKQGVRIGREEIRRGDLLFFTNASRCQKTGIERVGHVALYLGENDILHTASDFAKIEQISATRWGYFLEARRMV